MSAIVWDNIGERLFEQGVDRGVLYLLDDSGGVPWNGLTGVDEKPTGGEATPYYYDGVRYLTVSSAEEYASTLSAFTYPDEFGQCDGSAQIDIGLYIQHQPRQPFNLAYRTLIGNDLASTEYGYKIHLLYNVMANPAERAYKTLTDSTDAAEFSWDLSLTPPFIDQAYRSSGHLILDASEIHPAALTDIEATLYGTDDTDPRMPDLAELMTLVSNYADFFVIDNGDGSYLLSAPGSMLTDNDDGTFELLSDAMTDNGDNTFTIASN